MENEKLFELMTKMYSEMHEGFKEVRSDITDIKSELSDVKSELSDVKSELSDVKRTVINIEQDHGQKLEALFDGYVQHSAQLNRIEKEVATHEEIILRRI